jgi:two-component system, response regulator PdtaR
MDETVPKGPAIVLVVEDDQFQRMLAVQVVEDAGFVALEACDADKAVALLELRPDIALLFTDINIPGSMDGLTMAHAARNRWPPIKILVVSSQVRPRQSELPSNCCFVRKPYATAAMVAELRSLVGVPGF